MKNRKTFTVLIPLMIVASLAACKKDQPLQMPAKAKTQPATHVLKSAAANPTPACTTTYCGTPTVVELVAGQQYNAGTVTVSNDATNLTVTYTTTSSWGLREIHLYVGDCVLIPVNSQGSPVPGQFPYSASSCNSVHSYTFTIPLTSLSNCFCVAAEAVVRSSTGRTETAWGAGTRFSRSCWATHFSVCKQSCGGVCIAEPGLLFSDENAWPYGVTTVTVGGYPYTVATTSYVYFSGLYTDSRTALILIATLKIYGTNISLPASVATDAATVETWLNTLGPLNGNSQFTAPASVETAIANVQAWETSNTCH